jgi:hypothetical protein
VESPRSKLSREGHGTSPNRFPYGPLHPPTNRSRQPAQPWRDAGRRYFSQQAAAAPGQGVPPMTDNHNTIIPAVLGYRLILAHKLLNVIA